jgi:hypothetical protein
VRQKADRNRKQRISEHKLRQLAEKLRILLVLAHNKPKPDVLPLLRLLVREMLI